MPVEPAPRVLDEQSLDQIAGGVERATDRLVAGTGSGQKASGGGGKAPLRNMTLMKYVDS